MKLQKNKVYERTDFIDLNRLGRDGRSNLELIQQYYAPIGEDGMPINLHHSLQTMDSPLIEMTQTMHQKNHGVLHIWPNAAAKQHGLPTTTSRVEVLPEIDRAEFGEWRGKYWKNRLQVLEALK